jgi:hypothetical protein
MYRNLSNVSCDPNKISRRNELGTRIDILPSVGEVDARMWTGWTSDSEIAMGCSKDAAFAVAATSPLHQLDVPELTHRSHELLVSAL